MFNVDLTNWKAGSFGCGYHTIPVPVLEDGILPRARRMARAGRVDEALDLLAEHELETISEDDHAAIIAACRTH